MKTIKTKIPKQMWDDLWSEEPTGEQLELRHRMAELHAEHLNKLKTRLEARKSFSVEVIPNFFCPKCKGSMMFMQGNQPETKQPNADFSKPILVDSAIMACDNCKIISQVSFY